MKYILFIFNFIFFICGAAILGTSIWILVDPNVSEYVKVVNEATDSTAFNTALYLLIVVGVFIFLIGFLGCCGACKESGCMLKSYAAAMIFIIILQVAAAICAAVFHGKVGEEVKDFMADEVKSKVGNNNEDVSTITYNVVQMQLKCCGGNDFKDYGEGSKIYNDTKTATVEGYLVPQSCCVQKDASNDDPKKVEAKDWRACSNEAKADPAPAKYEQLYPQGCYDKLEDTVKDNVGIAMGVGFGLAFIEILGVLFACCVAKKIDE